MNDTIILPERLTREITITADIDRKSFVRIPDTTYFIAKQTSHHGQNFYQTLETVLTTTPFFVAPPSLFNPYYGKVCQAALQKNITLYDGTGEKLDRKATNDLFEYLSTEAQAWLDASFEQGETGLYLLTDHRFVQGKLQPQKKELLQKCVQEQEVLVDLVFNAQGLPMRKSKKQEYRSGENIYYWSPVDGAVVRFYASAGRADLGCGRGPRDSDAAIGVLLCAEGAAKK